MSNPFLPSSALAVVCPTCVAVVGKPCTSLSAWHRGEPCMPHRSRRLRAAKKIVESRRKEDP